ncbi:MAG: hypothetical protein KJ958_01010, partial [Gammaproteobacteria bacterium]|nr:hypothetical protein [Gammaproteobacteria bacterium]
RAPRSQCGGREFDPHSVHQISKAGCAQSAFPYKIESCLAMRFCIDIFSINTESIESDPINLLTVLLTVTAGSGQDGIMAPLDLSHASKFIMTAYWNVPPDNSGAEAAKC